MANLVVGMGEVGNGVFNVLRGKVTVFCRDKEPSIIAQKIDTLHIAIPYTDDFPTHVRNYMELYNPKATIVYSTVPIGTCEKLGVVHSPVEGKHPAIGLSIQNSARWLGSSDKKQMKLAKKLWEKFVPVRQMPSADFTEWLKLRSTSKYGINIMWTAYEAEVSKKLGMDFSAVKQFDLDYNQLYNRLGMGQYQRYILDPPTGPLGGHCVAPNAKILNEQYPNKWLEEIK